MIYFENKIEESIQRLLKKNATDLIQDVDFTYFLDKNENHLPYFLEIGRFKDIPYRLPALVPFIDSKGIVYSYDKQDEDNYREYFQSLLFQIIYKMHPNNLEIVIYDPIYLGISYSNIVKSAPENVSVDVLLNENQLQERLNKYLQYSKDLISKELLHYDSFIDYWKNSKDKNKKYVVFIINHSEFVKSNYITELIGRITTNTKNNNSFFILSDEESKVANYTFFNADFKLSQDSHFYKGNILDLEFEKSKENTKKYISYFNLINQANESTSDNYDIKDGLRIPIGSLMANGKPFHFRFASGTENYHAIIGGQSGKGKSVLLNTLIRRGMEKFHSRNLKFMLFDCKGVEFNDFEIDEYIIERESTPDVHVIIEKLKLIDEEFQRRRELFKEHNVKSIEQLVSKGIDLYRLVCIIDEFQFLFPVTDYKISQFAEDLLVSKILRTGRSFGIHLIVATQSLGDGVRGSILNNIPLRIALGMTEWQSASFLASNNTAAKNLERGVAIYNGNNGELASNELIKVDMVD